MSEESTLYEEHRGWTTRAIVGTCLCAPLGIAAIVGFAVTYNIKALIIGIVFLLGVINLAGGALSRSLALRVDAEGITLAGRGRNPATPIPWDQVQTVLLHEPRNIGMIGIVKSYAGVPAQPLNPGLPGSPPTPDVSMALDSWRVDFPRLKRVIGEVAPTVEVLDRR
jgi:uncharacterized membrane protein (Fun14 family)